MGADIDWKPILQQLVAAAIPIIIKMIFEWLQALENDDEAVAAGARAGKFFNAFKEQVA